MTTTYSETFQDDIREMFRMYNPGKKPDEVTVLLTESQSEGRTEEDLYASLCEKFRVKRVENREGLRKSLVDAVPEASEDQIQASIRSMEMKSFSLTDVRRQLERKLGKKRGSFVAKPVNEEKKEDNVQMPVLRRVESTPAPNRKGTPPPPEPGAGVSNDKTTASSQAPYGGRVRAMSQAPSKAKVDKLLAEEVREWLLGILKGFHSEEVHNAENVVDALRNGVVLNIVAAKLKNPEVEDASIKIPKSTGFFARDSVARFLNDVKTQFQLRTEVLFTDDDLCDGKNDRQVVNCLLALAGVTYKQGITEAPSIVRFDSEIEEQAKNVDEAEVDELIAQAEEEESQPPVAEEDSSKNDPEDAQKAAGEIDWDELEFQLYDEEFAARAALVKEEKWDYRAVLFAHLREIRELEKHHQDTIDKLPPVAEQANEDVSAASAASPPRRYRPKKGDEVDRHVGRVVNKVLRKQSGGEAPKTNLKRLRNQGEYVVYHRITGKKTVVYVRMVQKNLMIRVGGGWDDFEDWLSRHLVDCEQVPAGATQQERLRKNSMRGR